MLVETTLAISALESLEDHVCVLDKSGIILFVNRAWRAFSALGQGSDEFIRNDVGTNYLAVCDSATGSCSEEAGHMATGLRSIMRGDRDIFEIEYPCHSPHEERWFIARVTRCHYDRALTVVAHTNITELRRAKAELQRSRDALIEAQRISGVGSWLLDLRTQQLIWSAEIHRIFETDPDRFIPSYPAFLTLVHPQDRDKVDRAYTDSLANCKPYEIQHRLLFPDGRIKHVLERCETLYNVSDGSPIISRGTTQDITERHLAQQTLRLQAKLFTLSSEGILITDANNIIVSVNESFTRITGYALEELQGQNPSILASQHTPPETYQAMWQSLRETDQWQGEVWDRAKDGHVYPKWIRISVLRDATGEVTNHVASFTDLSEHKAIQERMNRLTHHNPLTGLFNRASLLQRLDQALRSAARLGTEVVILYVGLDRLKSINDGLGYQAGDAMLIEVGQRLRRTVRESDIVAHINGDEFVVVLTSVESAMTAGAAIAAIISQQLKSPFNYKSYQLRATHSIGLSIFPSDGADSEALIQYADVAMSAAKEQGKSTFRFFGHSMNDAVIERIQIEQELGVALQRQEFVLHYQPQIDTTNSRICGFEALIRWQHPIKGLVPPINFITIAEETGLIEALGAWVIDEACRQLAAWKAVGIHPGRIAVNLSAHQLRSPHLLELVRTRMSEHGICAGELELEVTESVAMNDPRMAIAQLGELRKLGIELAIDDFGTGYSSLAYLKLLPIQTLKLDRTFVKDIEIDDNDATISCATIALAHSLKLKVVAEGIETEHQRDFLISHGCDILQGYLFSKPVPADKAADLLLRERLHNTR